MKSEEKGISRETREDAIAREHAAFPLLEVNQDDPVIIDALKVKISLLEVLLKHANERVGDQDKTIKQMRGEIKTQNQSDEDALRYQKFDEFIYKVYEFMGW